MKYAYQLGRKLAAILLLSMVLLSSMGCTNEETNPQPITEMEIWEESMLSAGECAFYEAVTIEIGKVDIVDSMANVTVTMPDLESYFKNDGVLSGNTQTITIPLPVKKVNGAWEISSTEPLVNYIREETIRILIETLEKSGATVIDFDPQEVK